MLTALILLSVTALSCEIAIRLPLKPLLRTWSHNIRRAARVISSRHISDHWKETIIPVYAMRTLRASLMLFACLVLICLPLFAAGFFVYGGVAASVIGLSQPLMLLLITLVAILYLWMRLNVLGG